MRCAEPGRRCRIRVLGCELYAEKILVGDSQICDLVKFRRPDTFSERDVGEGRTFCILREETSTPVRGIGGFYVSWEKRTERRLDPYALGFGVQL